MNSKRIFPFIIEEKLYSVTNKDQPWLHLARVILSRSITLKPNVLSDHTLMSFLCKCSSCSLNQTVDTTTGKPTAGIYVSRSTYDKHRQNEGSSARMSTPSSMNRPSTARPSAATLRVSSSGKAEIPSIVFQAQFCLETSLALIRQHLADFRSQVATFLQHEIQIEYFPDYSRPLPLDFPIPPMAQNSLFLLHREAITKSMENLDTIPSYDVLEVREQRKLAVKEVLSHLDHLDTLMSTAWKQQLDKAADISEPSVTRSPQALINQI